MGGEHYSSKSGQQLSKMKDSYVKIAWKNWLAPGQHTVTALTREEVEEDRELYNRLTFIKKYAESRRALRLEVLPKSGELRIPCDICKKPQKVAKPLIQFEFRNWRGIPEELDVQICGDCVNKDPLLANKVNSLRVLGKNPAFAPILVCTSGSVCKFFTLHVNSTMNCTHVATDGYRLYCKRGHPGELSFNKEAWTKPTTPLSQMYRDVAKGVKDLDPALMQKFMNFYSETGITVENKEGRMRLVVDLEKMPEIRDTILGAVTAKAIIREEEPKGLSKKEGI